jgi:DNA invertase Pin-like site-specific DNA recombinase
VPFLPVGTPPTASAVFRGPSPLSDGGRSHAASRQTARPAPGYGNWPYRRRCRDRRDRYDGFRRLFGKRPGLDAMMKAVNAREFDVVASWSVDRLGRSLTDLLSILQRLHEKGVGLFLHQQGLDTSTTAGKAMFQMLGVFRRVRARHHP